jgi:lipoyl(octanoyl) transferase
MSEIGFTTRHPAQIRRLGYVFYGAGLRMQELCVEKVKEKGTPDQVLILEHNPVFTLGRNATRGDIHVHDAFLEERGVEVFQTDRGGQVTYHGPGQIVAYPICNLKGGREDLGRFVRGIEEVMIRTAGDFGVTAQRLQGFPGVWVDTPRGWEKLGALGIHLSKWISTHGIAFNVSTELHHFRWITPCGITDKGVCSLASLLGEAAPTWAQAADRMEVHFADVMGYDLVPVDTPSRSVSAITWRRTPKGPQVLMMLRQPDQGLWWSSVTGMVEPGESLEETATRELREETGLSGKPQPLNLEHTFCIDPRIIHLPEGELRFNLETCFHIEVPADQKVRLATDEHSEYRWCTLEEAAQLMRWEGSMAALKRLKALFSS